MIRRLVVLSALVIAGLPAVSATAATAAPTVSGFASPTIIFPAVDGYRDATSISATTDVPAAVTAEVRSASDTVVATLPASPAGTSHDFTWKGTRTDGSIVPAGSYVVRLTATDEASQTGTTDINVTVRSERLTWVTWTRTLTPKQAAKARWVGTCSTLRGNVNGWSGGFGFWSNSRCNGGTGERSFVESAFSSRVPTQGVFSYGAYRVDTVGRANSSRPTSRGAIGLYRASDQSFPKVNLMRSNYRTHPSSSLQGNTAVAPAGWVGWNVFTGKGHRWDARRFTVRLAIKVLRKPSSGFAAQSPTITGDSAAGGTQGSITAP